MGTRDEQLRAARYGAAPLREFAAAVLGRLGLAPADAALAAEAIVRADLRGIDTHGLARLPMYADRLASGGIDPRAARRWVSERGATAVLDAGGGLGHPAAFQAMERAIDLAGRFGIGTVAVRRSGHFGAADTYAMLALPHGRIGYATTNAPPALAPTGGLTPLLGTNPWALAIPAGAEPAIVMDFALTVVARGRIRLAQQRGEQIPPTWATDADGRPTTDPAEALRGLLLPMGGHKGYAMAIAIDVLAGILAGASSGGEVVPPQRSTDPQDVGHLFLAIDIAHFVPVQEFTSRVDALIRALRGSRRAVDVDRILLPGELEAERMRDREAGGVPLSVSLLADLREVAQRVGVEFPRALDADGR